MIVWLASFPRSGNTLLRTLLYQHFQLRTVADEPGEGGHVGWTHTTRAMLGYEELTTEWESLYRQALESPSIRLIKTHRPPIDAGKAIYVVRDGRSACVSYARYHVSFNERPQSLVGIVLGTDYYGGWSEHFRQWTRARNPLLVLRYEDLVEPDAALLARIAEFLGVSQAAGAWRNPFERLSRENPGFFREGRTQWQRPDDWSDLVDGIFFARHGDAMVEAGYATQAEVDAAVGRLAPEVLEMTTLGGRLALELEEYRRICDERQVVIDGLKRDCDERLALIEDLSAQLAKRRVTT